MYLHKVYVLNLPNYSAYFTNINTNCRCIGLIYYTTTVFYDVCKNCHLPRSQLRQPVNWCPAIVRYSDLHNKICFQSVTGTGLYSEKR